MRVLIIERAPGSWWAVLAAEGTIPVHVLCRRGDDERAWRVERIDAVPLDHGRIGEDTEAHRVLESARLAVESRDRPDGKEDAACARADALRDRARDERPRVG